MNRKERGQTEKLVARLVAEQKLELVDGAELTSIIDAVTVQLVAWHDERPRGGELGDLLAAHPQVAEVFADDDELTEAILGWRRAVRGVEVAITDARDPEIEAKLAAEPDDDLAVVYADWLIEHGNPLGELFACATDDKARKRVQAKHGAALWGRFAEYARLFDITWTHTGASAITVKRASALQLEWGHVIAGVLDLPLAAFCRSLSVGPLPTSANTQLDDLIDTIAAQPRPSISSLAFAGEGAYRPIDLTRLATGFPNLTGLGVTAYYLRTTLAHPKLEALALKLDGIAALEAALLRAELPNLRRLSLGTGYLAPSGLPLGNLVDAPWFAQLEELDVQGLRLGPDAVKLVTQHHATHVSHLRLV
jgi:uncharacterized protein (TIGR02996 family)